MRHPHRLVLPSLIAAVLLAGGCAWFGTREDYRSATETPPLEVPPPLGRPDWQGATRIPEPVAGATRAPAALPGATLRLEDNPDHAFRRVLTALDRAGEVTVVGQAEAERSLEVEVLIVREPEGNFLRRWLGRARIERERLVVRVEPEGESAARVVLLDSGGRPSGGEAARRVLAVLRQRLG
ncbi:MAG: hypothetical protein RML12_04610 [Xanthomonadales bacterium]|nr:hypothetical protein [Xanthomonadales bacterium]